MRVLNLIFMSKFIFGKSIIIKGTDPKNLKSVVPIKRKFSRQLSILLLYLKIAGRKRPALADPSHKVRQGGTLT